MELGTLAFPRKLSIKETETAFFNRSAPADGRWGVLNLGDGPFDGLSSGRFVGNSAGTLLAANVPFGFTGDLLDLQQGGVKRFSVDYGGTLTGGSAQFFSNTVSCFGTGYVVTANDGMFNVLGAVAGSGSMDGTAGSFAGAANGTMLAVNATSTFTGRLLDLQLSGSSKFALSGAGNLSALGADGSSAGLHAIHSFAPTITQSGTANYTALQLNVAETSTGTGGTNCLVDLQKGGVSQFQVQASQPHTYLNCSASSTSFPTTLGMSNFGTGNAARWQFGDSNNCLQNSYGGSMQVISYHGLQLYGRANGTNPAFGVDDSASTLIYVTNPGDLGLVVSGTTGQSGDLQHWTDNVRTPLMSVSASGAINKYAGSTPANGQLLIGNTTNGNFSLATLTAGTGVTITNGAGTITIASTAGGGSSWTWATKTASYTITTADTGILADATSASITITLPTAVGATQQYTVKRKDGSNNTVTVATTSAQTVDGATTYVLYAQSQSISVASDGSNWYIA